MYNTEYKYHYPPATKYKTKDPNCRSNILYKRLTKFNLEMERDRLGYKIYNKDMKIICLNLNHVEEFILFLESNCDRS